MQVAAAALLFYLNSDKRQRRCFFLPKSGSAATFQVAGAQLWSLTIILISGLLPNSQFCNDNFICIDDMERTNGSDWK